VTPGTHNFTIWRHVALKPKKFVFKDGAGAVIDLTGLTAHAEARVNVKDAAAAVDLEPEITDAAGGEVTIALTLAQCQALPAGIYHWDMVFEDGDGERIGPFVKGKLTIASLNTQPAAP
jgi:hypothetical protein